MIDDSVVRVMKTENIVPRAGIEPTYLAFPTSVLTITPCRDLLYALSHRQVTTYL